MIEIGGIFLLIGNRIKYLRQKKNLSLEVLAKGIVSLSHLSNIEAGRYIPSEEILSPLAKSLKVPQPYLTGFTQKDSKLETLLNNLSYKIHTDLEEANEILDEISTSYEFINSPLQEYYYLALKSLYAFKTNSALNATEIIDKEFLAYVDIESPEFQSLSPQELKEVVYYTYGLYYFYKKDFYKSNEMYEECKMCNKNTRIGDIHFNIALNFWKLGYLSSAIHNLNLALGEYLKDFDWVSIGDTYNFLGILYQETGQTKIAIETFSKISKLPEQDPSKKAAVLHNIGNLFFKSGEYIKSEEYLNRAIQIKREFLLDSLFSSVKLLAEIHIKKKNIDEAITIIEEARKYLTSEKEKAIIKILDGRVSFLSGDSIQYETLTKGAINILYKSGYYKELVEPCKLLASYYSDKFKYKLSSKYYFLALLCMEKELRR
jgi:HTH-type transcriptional regulator, quorum sensing regulator NprR